MLAIAASVVCCGQTISVTQLTHRVPAGAAREYRASLKALDSGDLARSLAHCQKAVAADPNNASAHNDLGVLYINNGQMEHALAEFYREIELEPQVALGHLNASFTLLALGRAQDAEKPARKAVEIERGNRRARLLLGWSLAAQFRYTAEALENLRRASSEFPEAHLAAADVLVHQGSLDGARSEVEAYLRSGAIEQRPVAEAWLKMLTLE